MSHFNYHYNVGVNGVFKTLYLDPNFSWLTYLIYWYLFIHSGRHLYFRQKRKTHKPRTKEVYLHISMSYIKMGIVSIVERLSISPR